jgi:hypothetical protein
MIIERIPELNKAYLYNREDTNQQDTLTSGRRAFQPLEVKLNQDVKTVRSTTDLLEVIKVNIKIDIDTY